MTATDPKTSAWLHRVFGTAATADDDQEQRPKSVPREGNNPSAIPSDAATRQFVRQLFGYDQ